MLCTIFAALSAFFGTGWAFARSLLLTKHCTAFLPGTIAFGLAAAFSLGGCVTFISTINWCLRHQNRPVSCTLDEIATPAYAWYLVMVGCGISVGAAALLFIDKGEKASYEAVN